MLNVNKMRVVVMGCGGSGGVPYAGNVWRDCNPDNPKNYRTRPSLFIEKGDTRIVIDTGPEFRIQINRTGIKHDQILDAVLYTHAHADHIMGIDDLRTFWFRNNDKPIDVYGTKETLDDLIKRFDYCFATLESLYPAMAQAHILDEFLTVGSLEIQSFEQMHGKGKSTGFRIGDFAYSTDVSFLSDEALDKLKGVKTWIVGSFHNDEGCEKHAGLNQVREWVEFLKPDITYLTHLTAGADYDDFCHRLPEHIRPAYDGLELFI